MFKSIGFSPLGASQVGLGGILNITSVAVMLAALETARLELGQAHRAALAGLKIRITEWSLPPLRVSLLCDTTEKGRGEPLDS